MNSGFSASIVRWFGVSVVASLVCALASCGDSDALTKKSPKGEKGAYAANIDRAKAVGRKGDARMDALPE